MLILAKCISAIAACTVLSGLPAAASDIQHPTPEEAAPELPSPEERIAIWRSELPGRPLPASLAFARPISDDEARDILTRHDLLPYQAFLIFAGGMARTLAVPETASLEVIAAGRRRALEMLTRRICRAPDRIEAMMGETATRETPAQRLAVWRSMLSAIRRSQAALPYVAEGTPIIYGLAVLGQPRNLERAARDPMILAVEPAAIVASGDETLTLVPPPREPKGLIGPRELPDVAALSNDQIEAALHMLADQLPDPPCDQL